MDKKPLILVIDDDDKCLQLIGSLLHHLDVNISLANSSIKVFDLLDEVLPDLIILDVVMPGVGGYDMCKKFKSSARLVDIPIIFLSAKNSVEDIVNGFNLGAADYLTKPVIKEELIARVNAQLSIKFNHDRLKKMVDERTSKLSEYNTAMGVLLEKRTNDKKDIESNIVGNINDLLLPMIGRIKKTFLDKNQLKMIEELQSRINEIVSPLARSAMTNLDGYNLTDCEVEVCMLIKKGYSTKLIADLLNASESTISWHRNNIREKLNIKNKNVRLKGYLAGFFKE